MVFFERTSNESDRHQQDRSGTLVHSVANQQQPWTTFGAQPETSSAADSPARKWGKRLGMTSYAVHGWTSISDQPGNMCFAFFSSTLVYQMGFAVMLMGRQSEFSPIPLCAHAILKAAGGCFALRTWRLGPLSARSLVSGVFITMITLSMTFVFVSLCVGPADWMPFHSVPLTTAIMAVTVLFVNISCLCGGIPAQHPVKPYANMSKPLMLAAVKTVQSMDSFTDLLMIRLLQAKAQGQCIWFGEPGQCHKFRKLSACLIAAVGTKYAKLVVWFFLDGRFNREDMTGHRVILGQHIVTLVCDLGIGAITLVDILSKLSARTTSSVTSQKTDLHRQLTTAIISCAFTFLSFAVSVIGFQKFLHTVHATAQRLSARVSQALSNGAAARARQSLQGQAGRSRVDQVAPTP